jgi:K+-transporting ATPase ATPase C chain
MTAQLRSALSLFAVLTVVTGIVYPLAVTGLAQVLFPRQANGSVVTVNGTAVGSALIGQQFSSPRYFWGRLSATGPYPYNAAASGGSNLGPLNLVLTQTAKARIEALRVSDPGNVAPVPVDLITASGSGLDPDLSLAGAYYQAPRIAKARGLLDEQVRDLIENHASQPWLGVFGEPRINILMLNLALDKT